VIKVSYILNNPTTCKVIKNFALLSTQGVV